MHLIKRFEIRLKQSKSKKIDLTFYKALGMGTEYQLIEPPRFRNGKGGIKFRALFESVRKLEADIRRITSETEAEGMNAEEYVKVVDIVRNGLSQLKKGRRMYGYG